MNDPAPPTPPTDWSKNLFMLICAVLLGGLCAGGGLWIYHEHQADQRASQERVDEYYCAIMGEGEGCRD